MDEFTERIPVELDSGRTVSVEVTNVAGEVKVSSAYNLSFREFADSIREIAQSIGSAIDSVKPDKATIEFGIEAGVEAGKLTAILVKGTGKANLKISLEWEKDKKVSNKDKEPSN
ncbi:MAG: hypothetical protein H6662_09140 [Ardenticatenaceae bacterium]|nr:hypothetical protein [Ardenticatenaceae bacterium]MCB8990746.1 hypothetical protein [Ardenticatenaceae bacterium]